MPRSKIHKGHKPGQEEKQSGAGHYQKTKNQPAPKPPKEEYYGPRDYEKTGGKTSGPQYTQHVKPPKEKFEPEVPSFGGQFARNEQFRTPKLEAETPAQEKWLQQNVLKKSDADELPDRLDTVSAWSGNQIPTRLQLALADGDLDKDELQMASMEMAKAWTASVRDTFTRFNPKGDQKEKKKLYVDPETGQLMTLGYARQLMQSTELGLMKKMLGHVKGSNPAGVATAFSIISRNLDTNELDIRQAFGASLAAAERFGNDTTKWTNFNQSLTALHNYGQGLTASEKLETAYALTAIPSATRQRLKLGESINSGYDVAVMRVMMNQDFTQLEKDRILKDLMKAQDQTNSDAPAGPASYRDYGGRLLDSGTIMDPNAHGPLSERIDPEAYAKLDEEQRYAVDLILNRGEPLDYDEQFNKMIENDETDANWRDEITPVWWEEIGDKIGTTLDTLDRFTGATGALAGGVGLPKLIDGLTRGMLHHSLGISDKDWQEQLDDHAADAWDIWHGEKRVSDMLEEDGVSPPVAAGIDIANQVLLDPTNLLGTAVTKVRLLRFAPEVMNVIGDAGRVRQLKTFIWGAANVGEEVVGERTILEKALNFGRGILPGSMERIGFARKATETALEAEDNMRFWSKWRDSFKTWRGSRGLDPRTMENVRRYVLGKKAALDAAGITGEKALAQISEGVGQLMEGAFDIAQKGGKIHDEIVAVTSARRGRAVQAAIGDGRIGYAKGLPVVGEATDVPAWKGAAASSPWRPDASVVARERLDLAKSRLERYIGSWKLGAPADATGATVRLGQDVYLDGEKVTLASLEADVARNEKAVAEAAETGLLPDQRWMYTPEAEAVDNAIHDAFRDMGAIGAYGVVPNFGAARSLANEIPFRRHLRIGERIDTLLGDTSVGKVWREFGSHLPPGAATVEHDLDTFVTEIMRRPGYYTRNEIAEKAAEAVRVMQQGPDRGLRFWNFMEKFQADLIAREGRRVGFTAKETEEILADSIKKIRKMQADHFGVDMKALDEAIAAGDTNIPALRRAQVETQEINEYLVMDPLKIRDELQGAIGYVQEFKQATTRLVRGAGKLTTPAVKANTVRKAKQVAVEEILTRGNSIWKFSVVASPRYVWRITVDETARFAADLGTLSRGVGAGSRARALEKVGIVRPNVIRRVVRPETATWVQADLLKAGFEGYDEAFDAVRLGVDERLDNLLPATRKVLDDSINELPVGKDASNPRSIVLYDEIPIAGRAEDIDEVSSGTIRDMWAKQQVDESLATRLFTQRNRNGGKVWGSVVPGEPNYHETLEIVLRNHFGRSVPGRMALEAVANGADPATAQKLLENFFTKTDEGKDVLSRLAVPQSRAGQQAEQIERYVRALTNDDARIAAAVLDEDPNLLGMLRGIPEDHLVEVNGMKASDLVSDEGLIAKGTNELARIIFELPTNKLTRQPFAKRWYTDMKTYLHEVAAAQDIPLTDDVVRSIEAQARQFAVNRTMQIMFDFRKQNRIAEMMRFTNPFMQPFFEAFSVWGHLLRQNPGFAARAVKIFEQAVEHGAIQEDPVTGEKVFPLMGWASSSALLHHLGFHGTKENTALPGWSLVAPVANMNFLFGSMFPVPIPGSDEHLPLPVPSFNPPVQGVVQWLAKTDIIPDAIKPEVASWAFEYGDSGGAKGQLKSLLPSFVGTFLEGSGIISDKDQLKSIATDMIKYYQAQGITPQKLVEQGEYKTVKEAEQALADKAMGDANQLLQYKAFFQLVMPTSPTINFPTAELEAEFQDLIASEGDYFKGVEAFNKKYDNKYSYLTTGSTVWMGGQGKVADDNPHVDVGGTGIPVPANEFVAELLAEDEKAKQFAKDHPDWFFALVPQEHWDDPFDRGAFFQQLDDDLRRVKDPLEIYEDSDVAAGWNEYTEIAHAKTRALEAIPNKVSSYSTSVRAVEEQFDTQIQDIQDRYPHWAQEYNFFEKEKIDPLVVKEAQRMVKIPLFAKTEVGKGLKDYLLLRNRVRNTLAHNNIESLSSESSIAVGADGMYHDGVGAIIKAHPEFERIYNTMFYNDFGTGSDRLVTTDAEKTLAALSPQERAQQESYDIRWAKINQKISNASDRDDSKAVAKAYGARRDFVQSMYDRYGAGSDNPLERNWATRTYYEQQTAIASTAKLPYIYLTEFDRRHMLGEKTNDFSEKTWGRINELAGDWQRQDAYAKAAAKKDPVFAEQLKHSNEWGYVYRTTQANVGENDTRGQAWRQFFNMLDQAQAEVERRGLHTTDDQYDPSAGNAYAGIQNSLQATVNRLKGQSELFRKEWEDLSVTMFMPSTWYRLGAFD